MPKLWQHQPEKADVVKRTCGYLGNPMKRPMVHGRHVEISNRAKHMENQVNNPKPCEWKSNELSRGYIADYKAFNFVDGEGVRCSLYVSGCPFHCEGCYNKAAQSFKYGKPYTKELEDDILKDIGHESVQGLTLLGGEPFLNTATCLSVVKRIRATYGETKDIWSWTGYTWDK